MIDWAALSNDELMVAFTALGDVHAEILGHVSPNDEQSMGLFIAAGHVRHERDRALAEQAARITRFEETI